MSIRVHLWLSSLALATLTLAVYWPVRHHAFINYDDAEYVATNWHVQAGLTWQGVAWAFTTCTASNWHPLTWLSHMLDCQLYGLQPAGHHLTSLLLHTANTLLLFLVLGRMTGARPGRQKEEGRMQNLEALWCSACVAALFAWHPAHVESVAWVSERKDVLSAFFFLLTLWAYSRYAECGMRNAECGVKKSGAGITPPAPRITHYFSRSTLHASLFYLLSLLFFALGLMSKPMLVTLPFVLLLLDYWPLGRMRNAECGMRTAESALTPAAPRSTLHAKRSTPPAFRSTGKSHIANRQWQMLLPLLVEKLPFLALSGACCGATLWAQSHVVVPNAVLPLGVRLGHVLTAYLHYLTTTIIPRHLAIFYPYPAATPVVETVIAGVLLAFISLLALRFASRRPYLVVGWLWFLGMLVPVIGLVQVGTQAWADRYTYLPLIGLFIVAVWGAGDLTRRMPALRLGYIPVGLALLTGTFLQLRYWQNSTTLFERALQVTRNNACAHYSLGLALADQGQNEAALRHFETALKIEPWRAGAQGGIASILSQQGDFAGAIARYRRALQIDPSLAEALNNLAWLLATCPDGSLRNGREAMSLAEKACELTEYHRTVFVGTLAAAYAEAGRFPEAVATAQKACELAAMFKEDALLARNRELLERYRAGQPYHEPAVTKSRF